MFNRTDSPSYGYAIIHGATSLTEDWNGPVPSRGYPIRSQNHLMFGAVDGWLTRSLAGIQQATVGNISYVEATYRTIRGWIKTQWDRIGTIFTLKVKGSAWIDCES